MRKQNTELKMTLKETRSQLIQLSNPDEIKELCVTRMNEGKQKDPVANIGIHFMKFVLNGTYKE